MSAKQIFSPAGIYRLQQLANLVYRHTGVRHRLSSGDNQLALLRAGFSAPERDIQACCRQLLETLTPQQRNWLASEGVTPNSLPRTRNREAG